MGVENSRLVDIGELRLHVRQWGEIPRIFWGHGLLGSITGDGLMDWLGWSRLPLDSGLVCYDARGHGRSEGSFAPEDYTWESQANDLLALLDALGSERVVLGGRSMGCAIAVTAARRHPERVRGLLLVNPPVFGIARASQAARYRKLAAAVDSIGVGQLARLQKANPSQLFPQWLIDVEGERLVSYIDTLWATNASYLPHILRGAALSELSPAGPTPLAIPALILGWQGDPSHPLESVETLAGAFVEATVSIASGYQQFQRWPTLVSGFLAGLPER